jgi:hypothetical protein
MDPCAGTGTFVLCIIDRLMRGLEAAIPNMIERIEHILANQVWAYDVCPRQVRRLLGGLRKLGVEHLARNVYNCNVLEQEFDMKFDVIVGNPPYNPPAKDDAKNNGGGNKIWHKFVEKAFEVVQEGGFISMITPNNWRTGKFTKSQVASMQDKIFASNLIWWNDANHHFKNVNTEVDAWMLQTNGLNALPNIVRKNALLPNNMDASRIAIVADWLEAIGGDCYVQDIGANDPRRFEHTRGTVPIDNIHVYKHAITGSKTQNSVFDWYSQKTYGFDTRKVMFFYSSGPKPIYDSEGNIGCGHDARAFSVSNDDEAREIIDFFSSDLCNFIIEIVSIKIKTLRCPVQMFQKIPKNWRQLETKHFP